MDKTITATRDEIKPQSAPIELTAVGTRRIAPTVFAVIAVTPVAMLIAGGFAHRWVDDDGFIYLRVVRNILKGIGPVYNAGERVEAGTGPLWTGILAALGAAGLRLEYVAVYAGLTFMALGLALGQIAAYRALRNSTSTIGEGQGIRRLAVPLGAWVFAALPPSWDYATSGLEIGLAVFWLGASYLALVDVALRPSPGSSASPSSPPISWILVAALFGGGPLIRPDVGSDFMVSCDGGTAVGVTGRSGALIDAAGVICSATERSR